MTSITQGSTNVYADLEFPDSEQMLLKAQLAEKISQIIQRRHLTQTEAASDGSLNVAVECLHTGGRAPAKLLRRKIQGLLPAMDGEPLILDFSGVKSAASSFLDELLGRLAAEDPRGQAIFEGPVRIQGMNPTVQAMANVVVAQRLTVLTV